jgi:Pyridine nucleotide-disulphide oxidoreductase
MKVIVIGAGPAGLAAAHAAAGLGADVRIIAPKVKTPQRGPVMLHRPIPGINTDQPDGYVAQLVIGGSILDYRLRLYGDVNIAINGDVLEPGFHTWKLPEAYTILWFMYHREIEDRQVTGAELTTLPDECDLVVNTAPIRNLCLKPYHTFKSVPVALKFKCYYPDQPENTVIYNAYPVDHQMGGWVRSSDIFGARVTEFKPEEVDNPDLVIQKPLSTDCNCHPRVLRTGRFGKWHNETWIDHAYYETRTALVSMMRQDEWSSIK